MHVTAEQLTDQGSNPGCGERLLGRTDIFLVHLAMSATVVNASLRLFFEHPPPFLRIFDICSVINLVCVLKRLTWGFMLTHKATHSPSGQISPKIQCDQMTRLLLQYLAI